MGKDVMQDWSVLIYLISKSRAIPSLQGWPNKAEEARPSHEVRVTLHFLILGNTSIFQHYYIIIFHNISILCILKMLLGQVEHVP